MCISVSVKVKGVPKAQSPVALLAGSWLFAVGLSLLAQATQEFYAASAKCDKYPFWMECTSQYAHAAGFFNIVASVAALVGGVVLLHYAFTQPDHAAFLPFFSAIRKALAVTMIAYAFFLFATAIMSIGKGYHLVKGPFDGDDRPLTTSDVRPRAGKAYYVAGFVLLVGSITALSAGRVAYFKPDKIVNALAATTCGFGAFLFALGIQAAADTDGLHHSPYDRYYYLGDPVTVHETAWGAEAIATSFFYILGGLTVILCGLVALGGAGEPSEDDDEEAQGGVAQTSFPLKDVSHGAQVPQTSFPTTSIHNPGHDAAYGGAQTSFPGEAPAYGGAQTSFPGEQQGMGTSSSGMGTSSSGMYTSTAHRSRTDGEEI